MRRIFSSLLFIAAAWALAGCATHREMRGPGHPRGMMHHGGPHFPTDPNAYKQCPQGDCEVPVTVQSTATGCIAEVKDEVIVLHRNGQVITWKIDPAVSPRTIFSAGDGIVVENDPREVFKKVEQPPNTDTEFRKRRAGPDFLLFKYTIRVIRNGVACEPLDPIIINQN